MKFNKSKNCDFCHKLFQYYEPPSYLGRTKYCSKSCQRKGRPKGFASKKEGYFTKVIKIENDCWDWIGHLKDGYGCFRFNGKDTKAHRTSWEIHYGEIPKGMYVCHKCDNRKCSNPEHLFLGTHLDNTQDMVFKNRQKGAIGSKNIKSKLVESDIPIIRTRINSNEKLIDIAKDYKISVSAISAIKYKRKWNHV